MKKNIKTILVLTCISILTACGTTNNQNLNNNEKQNETEQNQNNENPASEQGGEKDNTPNEDPNKDNENEQTEKEETLLEVEPISDAVRFFVPSHFVNIYAWTSTNGNTDLLGSWPGTALNSWDKSSNWKTYTLNKTSFNVIFNEGSNKPQTADLSVNAAGNYWYDDKTKALIKSDKEISSSQNPSSNPETGTTFKDDEVVLPSTETPQGGYTLVQNASDYLDLPVIKNYNKTQIINKYTGSRTDFRDESIYFTITTRFYDGDSSNNTHCWSSNNDAVSDPNWRGDFKGLIQKMDYIKAQGFTAIWITPIVKNASGFDYHGYHAINFKEVDPRYESEDVDFQTVINEAHKRDMKIVLDVVLNHSGNFGEENLFPMFYYDAKHNTSIKGMIRNDKSGILPASYDAANGNEQFSMRSRAMHSDTSDPNHIYHRRAQLDSWEGQDSQTSPIAGDCVDLDTENPIVANYLIEAYAKFIEMGVDAFRIDTMKHINRLTFNKYFFPAFQYIAKKLGNNSFHTFGEVCQKDHDVWNRSVQSISCPFYTWKETKTYNRGNRATNNASAETHFYDYSSTSSYPISSNAYLESGLKYHTPDHSKWNGNSVIDFPMHWNFDNTYDSFRVAKDHDNTYNDATYNVVYVNSHDYSPDSIQTQIPSYSDDERKERLSLIFTFRGVPCVYYGTEVKFQAGKKIDEGPNIALANSGRAYFGEKIEGEVKPTGFGTYKDATGNLASTLNSNISKHLQKLNQIRLMTPALRRGQYTTSNCSGDGISFIRRYTEGQTDSIAAVVIKGNANFTGLPNGTYKDLYHGTIKSVTNGTLNTGSTDIAIYVKQ